MEFLSTDHEECSVDYLLSDTHDFGDEFRLLMGIQDEFSIHGDDLLRLTPDTSSESDAVSLSNGDHDNEHHECIQTPPQSSLTAPMSQPPIKPCNRASKRQLEEDSGLNTKPDSKHTKNAIAARLNRQKKKQYVQGLEAQVHSLESENKQLKEWYAQKDESVSRLKTEVQYLKNVLANQSTLSKLLQNIPHVDDVRLSTSFSSVVTGQKRSGCSLNCDSMAVPTKRLKSEPHQGDRTLMAGVCLHVVNNTASLEFCAECSKRSLATTTCK